LAIPVERILDVWLSGSGAVLTNIQHLTSNIRFRWRTPLNGGRFLADVVKLETAERTPVNIPPEPFLHVTQRVLVHRVDVIDAAQLLHSKASAAGAAAGPAKEEKEPLVPRLALAAFLAFQDSMVAQLIEHRSTNTDQNTTATHTMTRMLFISNLAKAWQLAGK
jgi:hypothetical protein